MSCNNVIHSNWLSNPPQFLDLEKGPQDLPFLFFYVREASLIQMQKLGKTRFSEVSSILSITNSNGDTPLHYAIRLVKVEMVRLLLSWGADARIKNKEKRAPYNEIDLWKEDDLKQALSKELLSSIWGFYPLVSYADHGAKSLIQKRRNQGIIDICSSKGQWENSIGFLLLNQHRSTLLNWKSGNQWSAIMIMVGKKTLPSSFTCMKSRKEYSTLSGDEVSLLEKGEDAYPEKGSFVSFYLNQLIGDKYQQLIAPSSDKFTFLGLCLKQGYAGIVRYILNELPKERATCLYSFCPNYFALSMQKKYDNISNILLSDCYKKGLTFTQDNWVLISKAFLERVSAGKQELLKLQEQHENLKSSFSSPASQGIFSKEKFFSLDEEVYTGEVTEFFYAGSKELGVDNQEEQIEKSEFTQQHASLDVSDTHERPDPDEMEKWRIMFGEEWRSTILDISEEEYAWDNFDKYKKSPKLEEVPHESPKQDSSFDLKQWHSRFTQYMTEKEKQAFRLEEGQRILEEEKQKLGKSEILAKVEKSSRSYKSLDKYWKKDVDIAMAGVAQSAGLLYYMPYEMKDHEKVVERAMNTNAEAFQHASDRLKNMKKFALKAVQERGHMLHYCGIDMRQNVDVILEAVTQDGNALEYALFQTKKIVLAALLSKASAIKHIVTEFQADEEVQRTYLFKKEQERQH